MKQHALLLSFTIFFLYLLHVAQCADEHDTLGAHQPQLTHDHYPHDQSHHLNEHDSSDQDVSQDADSSSSTNMPESSLRYEAPTELECIRLNDTSLVIKWELNTAHALQYFKIQYKPSKNNKGKIWKTIPQEISYTSRAYQINKLRPGDYHFSVIAVYDNDDNSPSLEYKFKLRAKSKIRADELPEMKAPVVFWTESKQDYIRLKWQYEAKEKDMPNYGYLVYYRNAHQVTDFSIFNTLDENIEIAQVDPDTPYETKVVAYNNVTASKFSEIYIIKSAPNTTSQASTTPIPISIAPISTTTSSPISTSVSPLSSTSKRPSSSQTSTSSDGGTTLSPIVITNITVQKSPFQSMLDSIFKSDSLGMEPVLKYIIFVSMPILFIVLASLCLISCHRQRKGSPPSSTNDSFQFDLEVNAYFTNSFPGVEKEYHPPGINQSAHHGFVNNHPHINDFAY